MQNAPSILKYFWPSFSSEQIKDGVASENAYTQQRGLSNCMGQKFNTLSQLILASTKKVHLYK